MQHADVFEVRVKPTSGVKQATVRVEPTSGARSVAALAEPGEKFAKMLRATNLQARVSDGVLLAATDLIVDATTDWIVDASKRIADFGIVAASALAVSKSLAKTIRNVGGLYVVRPSNPPAPVSAPEIVAPPTVPVVVPQSHLALLGRERPRDLLNLIESGMLPAESLTFAAELAGQIDDARVVPVLVRLLAHDAAVVREGALYGLSRQPLDAWALTAIRAVARDDVHPDVRDAAQAILDDR